MLGYSNNTPSKIRCPGPDQKSLWKQKLNRLSTLSGEPASFWDWRHRPIITLANRNSFDPAGVSVVPDLCQFGSTAPALVRVFSTAPSPLTGSRSFFPTPAWGCRFSIHPGVKPDRKGTSSLQRKVIVRPILGLVSRWGPVTHDTQLSLWIHNMNSLSPFLQQTPCKYEMNDWSAFVLQYLNSGFDLLFWKFTSWLRHQMITCLKIAFFVKVTEEFFWWWLKDLTNHQHSILYYVGAETPD